MCIRGVNISSLSWFAFTLSFVDYISQIWFVCRTRCSRSEWYIPQYGRTESESFEGHIVATRAFRHRKGWRAPGARCADPWGSGRTASAEENRSGRWFPSPTWTSSLCCPLPPGSCPLLMPVLSLPGTLYLPNELP